MWVYNTMPKKKFWKSSAATGRLVKSDTVLG